jgi:hypothetical protein
MLIPVVQVPMIAGIDVGAGLVAALIKGHGRGRGLHVVVARVISPRCKVAAGVGAAVWHEASSLRLQQCCG